MITKLIRLIGYLCVAVAILLSLLFLGLMIVGDSEEDYRPISANPNP